MSKWKHRVSNISAADRTGDCAACGPRVPLKYRAHQGRWACKASESVRSPEAMSRRRARSYEATRVKALRDKYGMTPEQYEELIRLQGNVCGICLKACSTGRRLVVDHDHETGRVRGLLCNSCNRAIGLLGDTADDLKRAYQYLARP